MFANTAPYPADFASERWESPIDQLEGVGQLPPQAKSWNGFTGQYPEVLKLIRHDKTLMLKLELKSYSLLHSGMVLSCLPVFVFGLYVYVWLGIGPTMQRACNGHGRMNIQRKP